MTSLETTTADTAALYRARGWRPFPLDHPALPTCAGLHRPGSPCDDPTKRGKHPVVKYGTATAVEATDKMIGLWFHDQGPRNIGIACGPSGLVVIDEDDRNALAMLAADLGEDLPHTYRVQTARGWHYYFEAPTDQTIGNRSGRLAEYHIDVRGGKGMGGYVVAAGSTHHTGHVYVAEDDHAMPAPLPEWLLAEIQAPAGTGDDQGAAPGDADRWDDQTRYGTEAELKAQYLRHLGQVAHPGAAFREELFLAARDAWRLVDLGLLDEKGLARDLKDAIARVWGNEPNDDDTVIAYQEARAAAAASPWALRDPSAAAASPGEGERPDDLGDVFSADERAEIERRAYDAEVDAQVRRLDIAEAARRARAERDAPPRPAFADRVVAFDQLDQVPAPAMFITKLMPDNAVGFINGRSGSLKSFVLVAMAMAIGTGTPVMGAAEFSVARRGRVLYVAAEGSSGVALRLRAYAHAHAITSADVTLFPGAVNIADEAQVAEMYAYAAEHQFTHVFVDTFRAAAPGVQEKDNTEVGAVINRAIVARDEHGIGTLYADHTGHAGERAVGGDAKWANVDYALMVHMPGAARQADQQRVLRVEKLKDAETTGEWDLRLRQVDAIRDADGRPAAVLEVGSVEVVDSPFGFGDRVWWAAELPQALAEAFAGKAGRNAAMDIARILRLIENPDGVTPAVLRAIADEGPRKHSKSSWASGLALVRKTDVVEAVNGSQRLVLTDHWARLWDSEIGAESAD